MLNAAGQDLESGAATSQDLSAVATEAPLSESRDGVIVYVDLQNLHNFLSDQCATNPYQFHLVDFLKEWAASYQLPVAEIRVYTGIHSETREPQKAAATAKRMDWLAKQGVKVFTSKLAYSIDKTTGVVRPREKGVDVRLASELIQAVACDGVSRVLLMTQDNDLSQAVDVARAICRSRGERLQAFSPELKDRSRASGKNRCGYRGIHMTDRLDIPLHLVDKHSIDRRQLHREPEATPPAEAGPADIDAGMHRLDTSTAMALGIIAPTPSQPAADIALDPLVSAVETAARLAVMEASQTVTPQIEVRRSLRP